MTSPTFALLGNEYKTIDPPYFRTLIVWSGLRARLYNESPSKTAYTSKSSSIKPAVTFQVAMNFPLESVLSYVSRWSGEKGSSSIICTKAFDTAFPFDVSFPVNVTDCPACIDDGILSKEILVDAAGVLTLAPELDVLELVVGPPE